MIFGDHEEGFSAIELAIVLALTGLLAAIALPRWRGLVAKLRAQQRGPANPIRTAQSQVPRRC